MNRKLVEALQDSDKGREFLRAIKEAKRKGRALKAETLVPLPGPDKDAKRLGRRIRFKVARETVMARANGCCELCGRSGLILEAHHLISGPLRRIKESSETMLAICADCHRALHRNDMSALRQAKEVAIRLSMREALRAIERRIDKVLRTNGVPVQVKERR